LSTIPLILLLWIALARMGADAALWAGVMMILTSVLWLTWAQMPT
jgi:hypothetical protein